MPEGGPYRIGQRFGPYVLQDYLGSGSFKSVYRAQADPGAAPEPVVALGFPHQQEPEGIAALEKELQVARRLRHPNILRYYGMERHDGISFLVMEYVAGETLKVRMKQLGALPEPQVLRYLGLLGEALAYAHAAKVLHRDVKPDNVLIGAGDEPKLMDFGIARVLAFTDQRASTRIGTPYYMAPEQLNGAAGTNADLWALGVIGYQLLTGQRPFTGETQEVLVYNILTQPLDVQPLRDRQVDGRLIQVIRRLLNKDPEARYPTADDLARDLEVVARRVRLVDSDESRLEILIRASFPLIYVVSFEEARVLAALRRIAQLLSREKQRPRPFYVWSASQGLRDEQGHLAHPATEEDPTHALLQVIQSADDGLYVFLDLHRHYTPVVTRLLRDAARAVRQSRKSLVLLSPFFEVPAELEKEASLIGFQLPDKAQLEPLLQDVMTGVAAAGQPVQLHQSDREALVRAATGLTLDEAERAFRRAAAAAGGLFPAAVSAVIHEKRQIIRKSGILEYYPTAESFQSVGGLEQLLAWFRVRAPVFAAASRYAGPPLPKGVLLVGIPGCGKSLCARALAGAWGVPLLRLDMGRVFAGIVGAAEANLRRAIATAEAVSPCILWLDEVEKGLAGTRGRGGGGVAARIFGALLNWLQEKRSPVFVAATANEIASLPPELLRKGRFDEIFFVDLPSEEERRAIFAIQLAACGRDPERFDLARCAASSPGFSGAEIREAVISGLFRAFAGREQVPDRELRDEDLRVAIADIQPLSRALAREMRAMVQWAQVHARPASGR